MKYEYIHSGIDWIGKVPKHWRKEKIFRAAELITSGGTPRSGNEEYYEGDIYWIQSGDLNDGYVTETEKKITQEGLDNSSAKLFPAGTLLVAMYGATIGKLGIQTMEAATNQACCGIYPTKRIDLKFLFYFFHAVKDKYLSDSYGGGQPNISQSLIKQTYFFVPNKSEQIAISKYLDKTCAELDRVVEIKRKQIENLQQQLKSIIQHTVTRGLNPKVQMKESGIDWIGEVPNHWKVERLKDISKIVETGSTPPTAIYEYYENGTIPWFGPSSFSGEMYLTEQVKLINEVARQNGELKMFEAGSLMIIGIGATIGKVALISEPSSCNQQINIFTPDDKILPEYLLLFMKRYEDIIIQIAQFTTLPIFNQTRCGSLNIALPPKKEQLAIIKFIKDEIEKIKTTQSKIVKQIEVLLNYKKSLIHEVVTGKKQVYGLNKEKTKLQTT
jgi:type I restriction enzyme S subunit